MTIKLRTHGPGEEFKDIEVPPVICCGRDAVLDNSVEHIAQECHVCGRRYVVSVQLSSELSGFRLMDRIE